MKKIRLHKVKRDQPFLISTARTAVAYRVKWKEGMKCIVMSERSGKMFTWSLNKYVYVL